MNSTELLDQFVIEARECLEQIGHRLLEVERDPSDRELMNDLFRQVHTLKGNCGLFEFKALERVVHAGEDLLDRVRNGSLAYSGGIADALLEAMDYTAELIDAIADDGALPAAADGRAQVLAAALREHLTPATPARPGPAAADAPGNAEAPAPAPRLPDWALNLPAALQRPGLTALRYRPESECFFKGEDPWYLARSTPGLQHLAAGSLAPWPAADDFDCYRCNLELLIVSDAPATDVEAHFRYVPEQVETCAMAAPATVPAAGSAPSMRAAEPAATDRGPDTDTGTGTDTDTDTDTDTGTGTGTGTDTGLADVTHRRIVRIWNEQRALIARPGVAAGTVAATRTTLAHLLACWGESAWSSAARSSLATLPSGAAPLAGWAQQHQPMIASENDAAAAENEQAGPLAGNGGAIVAALEARRGGNPAADEAGGTGGQKVLKVNQDKIDRLMELIGEMVVAKNALPYLAQRAEDVFHQRELAREIKTQYSVINRIAEDMQHAIMEVRMLPVGTVFQRFGRLVRDLSKKLGKEVALVVEGEDTEADKNVIESLADPLIHILRNSLDHGIELPAVRLAAGKPARGTLRVRARQEADRVLLDISDDGAGIDTARVRAKAVSQGLIGADRAETLSEHEAAQLVFLPGFSTADVISDLSGRGVGMDVVRNAVERINGTVALTSVRGQGTTIRLALPLSMAVTNVMMIETAGRRFGVPMDLIVETVRVPADDIHHFKRAMTTVLRSRIVPLRPLNDLLALDQPAHTNDQGEHAVLVVRLGAETTGLLVDDFHGTSDIILKPLEGVLTGITGFAGTALMGDGSVLMILSPKELM